MAGRELLLQVQERTLVFRGEDADDCNEWATHLQARIIANRQSDFAACIGDDDTKFWANTVKPANISGHEEEFALCKVYKDSPEWSMVLEVEIFKSQPYKRHLEKDTRT